MGEEASAIRFDEESFDSVPRFLELVAKHRALVRQDHGLVPLWFRGHRDVSWKLATTLKRQGIGPDQEPELVNRFRQNAVNYLGAQSPPDDAEWDWMFLMRHHGAPSRLLDWTESALIGLYFAVEQRPSAADADSAESDGHVWVVLPTVLNYKCNVRNPASRDGLGVPMFALTADSGLNNYETGRVSRETSSSVPPGAGHGLRRFPRMEAQQSTFTIHHADQKPLEEWHDSSHVWRYRVPAAAKADLRAGLRDAGINRFSLFRDLDSAAWEAEEAVRA